LSGWLLLAISACRRSILIGIGWAKLTRILMVIA
jgi:hypothetical protein